MVLLSLGESTNSKQLSVLEIQSFSYPWQSLAIACSISLEKISSAEKTFSTVLKRGVLGLSFVMCNGGQYPVPGKVLYFCYLWLCRPASHKWPHQICALRRFKRPICVLLSMASYTFRNATDVSAHLASHLFHLINKYQW